MIELRKEAGNKSSLRLYIDGIWSRGAIIRPNYLYRSFESEPTIINYDIRLQDIETSRLLQLHSFSDLPEFSLLGFQLKFSWTEIINSVRFKVYDIHSDWDIIFRFSPDFSRWKPSYNFASYVSTLYEKIKETSEHNVIMSKVSRSDFNVIFTKYPNSSKICDVISYYEQILKEWHIQVEEILLQDLESDIVFSSFRFPLEAKTACKQYLLYFAQFLQDLGINATSNLKEEAGKVLFSVTPTDDVEALDKIREALAVYLNLPASPIVYNDSFAAMRLQQQIENLQHSQRMAVRELQFNEKLLTAQSDTISEKNITISQQQSVIEQQHKIIEKISSKSIMMDSAENKEELEELYEGVKVGESKWLKELTGIELNPAKAIKAAVKNTFGKDEKKSVLGLDED